MKRTVLVLLALSMLFSVILTSCADTKKDEKPAVVEDLTWEDQKYDFDGATITMVYVEGEQGTFTKDSIEPDEDDGDAVVSKLLDRNAKIENLYNVDIVAFEGATGISNLTGAISNQLASGDQEYDVIAGYQYYDLKLAASGYLLDYNTLDQYDADFLNLDKDHWATNYNQALSYNNKMYWITGDIALRYIGGMYCTLVNGEIYRNALEADYGSLYDIVRSGKWTLDIFTEMTQKVWVDRNANETNDEDDLIGYVSEVCDDSEAMALAAGVRFSTTDPISGDISISFSDPRTQEFGTKYYNLVYGPGMLEYADNGSQSSMRFFAGENALFVTNKLFQAQIYLQEMKDYYVIPLPKYDENQEDYISYIHDGCTIFGINNAIVGTEDLKATAATLEAMAQESHKNVSPVYYDSALKYKYTRDDSSAEMIDLIHRTCTTDFCAAWSNSISDIAHFFRSNTKSLKNITAAVKKGSKAWGKMLDQLLEQLDEASETVEE